MISSQRIEIGAGDDAGVLVARLGEAGGRLLVEAVDALEAGTMTLTPQPGEGVSLAPKITDEDRLLDVSRPASDLVNRVRALSPHIGATLTIDGERFKVWRARARAEAAPPGITSDGGVMVVGCAGSALEILEIQPPSRARMDAGAFLRGYRGPLELGRAD
jgi:methionyl-tRNA formyltransferase